MRFSRSLQRLFGLLTPYKGRILVAFTATAITAATEPTVAALMKELLDNGFVQTRFPIWLAPLFVIGIFLIRGMATFTAAYLMAWVSGRMAAQLRQQMFDRLLQVPIGFHDRHATGHVLNTMMVEVIQVLDLFRSILVILIRDSLTVLGLIGYLFWLNWKLTLITLALVPLVTIAVRLTAKRLKRLIRESQQLNGELMQTIDETIRARHVIKIFGGQRYEGNRFAQRADRLRGFILRQESTAATTEPITQLLNAISVAVIITIALMQAGDGQMTVGGFTSFIIAMLLILTPMKHLANISAPIQRSLAACERVFGMMDEAVERTGGVVLKERAKGHLSFQQVSFSYPDAGDAAVAEITMDIAPGETVALVGMSGGGKSTLVNLVPAFHEVSAGQITLDGQPIAHIDLASLRAQIAMVSQHVVLFDDTIAANIAYADSAPDPLRIESAVRAAHLDDVIAALPEGLSTMIGDNGMRLSGGQRQRLAIARALYKDAPILILDEATSALDSESERAVQQALDSLMRGRTTLVIAHRLSTVERADRIAVLEHGRLVEIGSHTELLKLNGVYAHLYQLQFARET
ncbi:MAG: lipid export permease/ATP-binding protein MsbA [Pseudomonadota bacterium]|jgi:subfamily B ATP-binding cassette protein MsbA